MVAMVSSATPRERLARPLTSAKLAPDIPSKLDSLRLVKDDLLQDDPVLLAEFLPQLLDLLSDRFSPVRKFIIKVAGEIGMKQPEFLPEIVPAFVSVLKDESPPVARQAIACGIELFRCIFEKIALQGLYSSELDDSLVSSWAWMLDLKEKICSIAFQMGGDGVKLIALKFVEAIILLYTPDPSGTLEPPSRQCLEGDFTGFNISWLRGGHPALNIGELSTEASQHLGFMLDQLRFPAVKSLSGLSIVVLINSISTIAKRRPAFFGRILPVLLDLDPISDVVKGVHIYGARHALKNAFKSCLESKHPGAAPWRHRLNSALRELEDGGLVKQSLDQDYKINRSSEGKNISLDEKPAVKAVDSVSSHSVKGRKRPEAEDRSDQASEEDTPGKRAKPSPSISEESSNELKRKSGVVQEENSSSRLSSRLEADSGAVQQLVAMFGALVAQGEKAAGPLEILISSISADLLAEVVMANMRHLPPERPMADEEEGSQDYFSLASAFPQIASLLDAQQTLPDPSDHVGLVQEHDHVMAVSGVPVAGAENVHETESNAWHTAAPSSSDVSAGLGKDIITTSADNKHEMEGIEGEIPGLASSTHTDGQSETVAVSSFESTDLEANSQEQETSLIGKSPVEMLPSISNDRSEELSPKPITMDGNMSVSSSMTSAGLSYHVPLPELSAPVVNLPDDQKDHLQKLAFARIIEAYKDVEVAGASEVRSSLLSYIGVEFPSDLEPWKLLQQHIIADYVNHEGHEMTLRLLYRLFGESEVESDFFSSTSAASAYETLLLNVGEALRDSFPASDKYLSRLLVEVPYLPQSVLNLLEQLCSPSHVSKPEESQGGDRVTQGLSAVWSLILLRPPMRNACLKIALQSTIHPLEEVRMKAIRLVANKLYPLSSVSQQIEEFAKDTLLSVTNSVASDKFDDERPKSESIKDAVVEKGSEDNLVGTSSAKDDSSDGHQSSNKENLTNSISEAQRCMSLYFALCTKKHALFRHIFILYESTSKAAKEAIQRHIPMLVRTMGASSELLEIISDAPAGSLNLLLQVIHTLTDGAVPSPELLRTIRKLYDSKIMDVDILMPILPFLKKDEVLGLFPRLVNLSADKFQAAVLRILTGSTSPGDPPVSPAEILIAIHGIGPERDGIPLKKVTDACNCCFEQRQIFTQQVLAKVMNQLVEQIPLPLLFMRTVLQSILAFPGLVGFILEILSRLVNKQIWNYPKLWVGFLKCAKLTKPQSFPVLLQLPPAQLENALNKIQELKEPLAAHASQPNVRPSLPRSVLAVLGIVTDAQTSSNPQSSQAQSSLAQSSPARSSPAQSSQAQSSQVQSSLAQSSPTRSSPAQTSQNQTVDTGTSDKEAGTEKESSAES